MRRFAVLVGVTALAASSLVVALASGVAAGGTGSTSFTQVGSTTYEVPPGVCEVTINAIGARGGNGGSDPTLAAHQGGLGGQGVATIPVTPLEVLNVFVGGRGQDRVSVAGGWTVGGLGGFNGGGNGGNTTDATPTGPNRLQSGGGAGGASDVRQGGTDLANRVVVGGGGGGAGASSANVTNGGTGGGTNGNPGLSAASQANPGQGGTQNTGGAGGTGLNGGATGGTGQFGVGGIGANGAGAGGGGGGGWYGGGGAGAKTGFSGAGGGGGSGFTPTGASLTNGVDATNSGNGRVTITPAPQGVGCPSVLQVRKVVKGESEDDGFIVHVSCTTGRGPLEVDLPFDEDGSPAPPGPAGWTVEGGAWQFELLELRTCTATETDDGDADSVRYACEYTPGVTTVTALVPIEPGCSASGPSAHPLSVTFLANADRGVLTVTNKFDPEEEEEEEAEEVVTQAPVAAPVQVAPRFTG